ncbi:MAG: hypothetical protein AVDCRST_MAG88-4388, partial [uncultured Thermomicrobiales bacterium]
CDDLRVPRHRLPRRGPATRRSRWRRGPARPRLGRALISRDSRPASRERH